MPYLDGRSSKIQKRLPYDALIETNIYDINLNDFAPMGYKQLTKFIYRTPYLVDFASSQVDEAMNRFIMDNHVRIDKREEDMILSGEDVVLIIGNPLNGTRLRFDDILGFVDEQILAISPLDPEIREELEEAIRKKFRNDLAIIDLPLGGAANDEGNCGIYTAVMSTNKKIMRISRGH
uniref:Uncharacterized protein n=1 Tax=Panagrolaimus sp. ES5 TaxID=591445 RepID=A0AC34FP51_9BILA